MLLRCSDITGSPDLEADGSVFVCTGRGRTGEITGIGRGAADQAAGTGAVAGASAMCLAMCAASAPTKPSSADPRVCCQARPRKYRPGTGLTPRWWTGAPAVSVAPAMSMKEESERYPVAHTMTAGVVVVPSAKVTE